MNRKWLIAAMVLPLLGGCSSENDAPEVVEQIPISLSNVSGDWTQTRGQLVESLDNFKSNAKGGGAFHVEGFKYMSADDTNPERVFTNQLVSWDKTNNEWTYSKLKFWDIAAEKYRFVGYYPANLIATSPSHLGTVDQNTLTLTNLPNWKWISVCDDTKLHDADGNVESDDLEENPLCCEYRNGEAMDNFYDAMIAYSQGTPQTYLSGENPGYVNLHFKHIYAMFVFKVAFPNIDVGGGSTKTKYVSEINIKDENGLPSAGGTFNYTFKYNTDGTTSGTYNNYEAPTQPVAEATTDVPYYGLTQFANGVDGLSTPVEALKEPHMIVRGLVVPFDLGEKVLQFNVGYFEDARGVTRDQKKTTWLDADGKLKTTLGIIKSANIPVKDVNNQDLHKVEAGKVYTFTINFDTGIKLDVIDVAVSEWKEYSSPITQNFYNW